MAVEITTTRFGLLRLDSEDLIQFPAGLFGLEDCRQWVLLGDLKNPAVAWLQSADRPRVALAVVAPRRFVPNYRIRVARAEMEPIGLADPSQAQVLVIVGQSPRGLTLNLKAPLILNAEQRCGRQVVTNGDLPLQFELEATPPAARKIA